MSALWNSLLAQADADDRAALANSLAAELRQQLEAAISPNDAAKRMLSPAEVALSCRVHVETVRRAIRSGQLPAVKIGSRFRVDPRDLERGGSSPEHAPTASPAAKHHRRARRSTGVMAQAVNDLYSRQMEKARERPEAHLEGRRR